MESLIIWFLLMTYLDSLYSTIQNLMTILDSVKSWILLNWLFKLFSIKMVHCNQNLIKIEQFLIKIVFFQFKLTYVYSKCLLNYQKGWFNQCLIFFSVFDSIPYFRSISTTLDWFRHFSYHYNWFHREDSDFDDTFGSGFFIIKIWFNYDLVWN